MKKRYLYSAISVIFLAINVWASNVKPVLLDKINEPETPFSSTELEKFSIDPSLTPPPAISKTKIFYFDLDTTQNKIINSYKNIMKKNYDYTYDSNHANSPYHIFVENKSNGISILTVIFNNSYEYNTPARNIHMSQGIYYFKNDLLIGYSLQPTITVFNMEKALLYSAIKSQLLDASFVDKISKTQAKKQINYLQTFLDVDITNHSIFLKQMRKNTTLHKVTYYKAKRPDNLIERYGVMKLNINKFSSSDFSNDIIVHMALYPKSLNSFFVPKIAAVLNHNIRTYGHSN